MKPAREKMKEMDQEDNIRIVVAEAAHEKYVDTILETIREAAKKRGTGIAERTHEYVASFILVATYSCVRSTATSLPASAI